MTAFKSRCCVIPELHHLCQWLVIINPKAHTHTHTQLWCHIWITFPCEDVRNYSSAVSCVPALFSVFAESYDCFSQFTTFFCDRLPFSTSRFHSTTAVTDWSHNTECCSWRSTILFSHLAIVSKSLQDEFIFSWLKETRPLCVLYRNRQWFITHRQRHIAQSTHPLRHTRGWSWLITKVSHPTLLRLNSPGATWKRRWMDLRDNVLSFCQTHSMKNTQTTSSNSGRCLASALPFTEKVHSAHLQSVSPNFCRDCIFFSQGNSWKRSDLQMFYSYFVSTVFCNSPVTWNSGQSL